MIVLSKGIQNKQRMWKNISQNLNVLLKKSKNQRENIPNCGYIFHPGKIISQGY